MSDYLCPNCNSGAVVPDSRRFHGEEVFRCMNCTSWFTESGEPVCFESDCGGDDLPDDLSDPRWAGSPEDFSDMSAGWEV